jgi:Ca2+/H+ antiporter, TMEM165/GDT1 family
MDNLFLLQFFVTFSIIVLAEFGDKTNLIILSLAAKTKMPLAVAIGGILGITLISLLGILLGSWLITVAPIFLIKITAGLIFIGLGIINYFDDKDDADYIENEDEMSNQDIKKNEFEEGELNKIKQIKVLIKSLWLVGLGEFGDKSQIFVITQATVSHPVAVLFGAVLGMGLIIVLSAYIGDKLLTKLSKFHMTLIVTLLFIVAGSILILQAIYSKYL